MTATGVDLRSMVQSIHAAFNAHDPQRVLDQVDDEYEQMMMPTGEIQRGKESFVAGMQSWIDGFSNARTEIQTIVVDGDTAVIEFRGHGTHDGEWQTPMGPIPPTGRTVEIPFCQVLTFRNGKVYRDHLYFDLLTILRQLGIDPSAGQPI